MLIFKPIVVSMKNLVTKTVNSMTMKFYMSFFFKGIRMKEKNRNGYLLHPPHSQVKINEEKTDSKDTVRV